MREKPPIPDGRITAHLQAAYGLRAVEAAFLPLGADYNTAVYRVTAAGGGAYFFKLRKGNFEAASLLVPHFLHAQGVRQVIPPIPTREGDLWARMDGFCCALYPFIEGREGWGAALTEAQWRSFGAALRGVHGAQLPPALRAQIAEETFTGKYRAAVRGYLEQAQTTRFNDPVAAEMATSMRAQRARIERCVERAEALAKEVGALGLEQVLCHSDIHAGNLLLTAQGGLYIVDWDNPVLAPKERDLMFIGAGIGDLWNTRREEELFYQGYGEAVVVRRALAYYRYERIVQDIAAYCAEVMLTEGDGEDRRQGLEYFESNFVVGGVLDIAEWTEEE